MKPEGSSPHSQQPATCPYSVPGRFNPSSTRHFSNISFNIILPSHGKTQNENKCIQKKFQSSAEKLALFENIILFLHLEEDFRLNGLL
jgi:hypothetical protein